MRKISAEQTPASYRKMVCLLVFALFCGLLVSGAAAEDDRCIYNGTVVLNTSSFTANISDFQGGGTHEINWDTPAGVLAAAGYSFDLWESQKTPPTYTLCNVTTPNGTPYPNVQTGGNKAWRIYKNFSAGSATFDADISLADGDVVYIAYGNYPDPAADPAGVYLKATVSLSSGETPWTVKIIHGTSEIELNASEFADAVATSGVTVSENDSVWTTLPMQYLCGLVDDENPDSFNFDLAKSDYTITVTANDGFSTNFRSTAISADRSVALAYLLNGSVLPETIDGKNGPKPCFPLQMVGVTNNQRIGGVTTIELSNVQNIACTLDGAMLWSLRPDMLKSLDTGSGIPLAGLVGLCDDREIPGAAGYTLNQSLVSAGYDVLVSGSLGTKTIPAGDLGMYTLLTSGDELSLDGAPEVGVPERISLSGTPFTFGDWNVSVMGPTFGIRLTADEVSALVEADPKEYTIEGKGAGEYRGMLLTSLLGYVDGDVYDATNIFDADRAAAGYTIAVAAADGKQSAFDGKAVAANPAGYILATSVNGTDLGEYAPLRIVGSGVAPGPDMVGQIVSVSIQGVAGAAPSIDGSGSAPEKAAAVTGFFRAVPISETDVVIPASAAGTAVTVPGNSVAAMLYTTFENLTFFQNSNNLNIGTLAGLDGMNAVVSVDGEVTYGVAASDGKQFKQYQNILVSDGSLVNVTFPDEGVTLLMTATADVRYIFNGTVVVNSSTYTDGTDVYTGDIPWNSAVGILKANGFTYTLHSRQSAVDELSLKHVTDQQTGRYYPNTYWSPDLEDEYGYDMAWRVFGSLAANSESLRPNAVLSDGDVVYICYGENNPILADSRTAKYIIRAEVVVDASGTADVLCDTTVDLTSGESTAAGALDAAGLVWTADASGALTTVGSYTGDWSVRVGSTQVANVSACVLSSGDILTGEFTEDGAVTAKFKIVAKTPVTPVFSGTVLITSGDTQVASAAGASYTVSNYSLLGALRAAGLDVVADDKSWQSSGVLSLAGLGGYVSDAQSSWSSYLADGTPIHDSNPVRAENTYILHAGDVVSGVYTKNAFASAAYEVTVRTLENGVVTIYNNSVVEKNLTVSDAVAGTGVSCVYGTDGNLSSLGEFTNTAAASWSFVLDGAPVSVTRNSSVLMPAGSVLTGLYGGDVAKFVVTAADPAPVVSLFDGTVELTSASRTVQTNINNVPGSREMSGLTALAALEEANITYVLAMKTGETADALLVDYVTTPAYPDFTYMKHVRSWELKLADGTVIDGWSDATKAVNLYQLKNGDVLTGTYSEYGRPIAEFTIRITVKTDAVSETVPVSSGNVDVFGSVVEFADTSVTNVTIPANTPFGVLYSLYEDGIVSDLHFWGGKYTSFTNWTYISIEDVNGLKHKANVGGVTYYWDGYLNGVKLDGELLPAAGSPTGYGTLLSEGDEVVFAYVPAGGDVSSASAVVRVTVTGSDDDPVSSVVPRYGPFVTSSGGSDVTIRYKLSEPASGAVEFRPASGGSWTNIPSVSNTMHVIPLTGLSAATDYQYRVLVNGSWTKSYTFRTLGDTNYTYVITGDTGPNGDKSAADRHKYVAEAIIREKPLFVVHLGDFVGNGTAEAEWDDLFAVSRDMYANTIIFPVLGNHDDNSTQFEMFGMPNWYSVDAGKLHLLVLDTSWSANSFPIQSAWMAADLAGASDQVKTVYFHFPIYTSDRVRERYNAASGYNWSVMFRELGVDTVFSGHFHAYERLNVNGTRYVTAGIGGSDLSPRDPVPMPASYEDGEYFKLGYVRGAVSGDSVSWEMMKVADVDENNSAITQLYAPPVVSDSFSAGTAVPTPTSTMTPTPTPTVTPTPELGSCQVLGDVVVNVPTANSSVTFGEVLTAAGYTYVGVNGAEYKDNYTDREYLEQLTINGTSYPAVINTTDEFEWKFTDGFGATATLYKKGLNGYVDKSQSGSTFYLFYINTTAARPDGFTYDFQMKYAPYLVNLTVNLVDPVDPTPTPTLTPTVTPTPTPTSGGGDDDTAPAGLSFTQTTEGSIWQVGESIPLTATLTAGTNVVYTWDMGNGDSVSGAAANYTYEEPGKYSLKVTASNGAGSESAAATIVVYDPANPSAVDLPYQILVYETVDVVRDMNIPAKIAPQSGGHVAGEDYYSIPTASVGGMLNALQIPYDVWKPQVITIGSKEYSLVNLTVHETLYRNGIVNGTDMSWRSYEGMVQGAQIRDANVLLANGTKMYTVYAPHETGADRKDPSVAQYVIVTTLNIVDSTEEVAPANAAINAPTRHEQFAGSTIDFRGTATGTNLSYLWNFGDGTTAEGASVTHVFASTGNYTVTFTASNSLGTTSATYDVKVTEYPAQDDRVLPQFGPFILSSGGSDVTIRYVLADAAPGEVAFRPASGGDWMNVSSARDTTHVVPLTGLSAATEYEYRVLVNGNWTDTFSFTTLGADSFTYVIVGDTAPTYPYYAYERSVYVADAVAAEKPLFIVNTGDFTGSGDVISEWEDILSVSRDMYANAVLFTVRGNHETDADIYSELFGVPMWYSADAGPLHMVFLDTNTWGREEFVNQTAWLRTDLAAADPASVKTVYFHHPFYTSDRETHSNWGLNATEQAEWESIFAEYNVTATFSGHFHAYERYLVNGTVYVTAGIGGSNQFDAAGVPEAELGKGVYHTLGYLRPVVSSGNFSWDMVKAADFASDNSGVTRTYPAGVVIKDTYPASAAPRMLFEGEVKVNPSATVTAPISSSSGGYVAGEDFLTVPGNTGAGILEKLGYQYDLWKPMVITPTKQYSLVNVTVNGTFYPNLQTMTENACWTMFTEYRAGALKYDANIALPDNTTVYFAYGNYSTVRQGTGTIGDPTAADYLLIVTMLFGNETLSETLFDGAVGLVNDSNRTFAQAVKASGLAVTMNGSTISGIGEYTVSDSAFWNFTVNNVSCTESYLLNNGDVLRGEFTNSEGRNAATFAITVNLYDFPTSGRPVIVGQNAFVYEIISIVGSSDTPRNLFKYSGDATPVVLNTITAGPDGSFNLSEASVGTYTGAYRINGYSQETINIWYSEMTLKAYLGGTSDTIDGKIIHKNTPLNFVVEAPKVGPVADITDAAALQTTARIYFTTPVGGKTTMLNSSEPGLFDAMNFARSVEVSNTTIVPQDAIAGVYVAQAEFTNTNTTFPAIPDKYKKSNTVSFTVSDDAPQVLFDGAVSLVNDSNRTIAQAVMAANLTVTMNGSVISGIGEYTVSDSAFWNFAVNNVSCTESYLLNDTDVLTGVFTSSGSETAKFRIAVSVYNPVDPTPTPTVTPTPVPTSGGGDDGPVILYNQTLTILNGTTVTAKISPISGGYVAGEDTIEFSATTVAGLLNAAGIEYDVWKSQKSIPTYSLTNITCNGTFYPNIQVGGDKCWRSFDGMTASAKKYDVNVNLTNGTTIYTVYGDYDKVNSDPGQAEYVIVTTLHVAGLTPTPTVTPTPTPTPDTPQVLFEGEVKVNPSATVIAPISPRSGGYVAGEDFLTVSGNTGAGILEKLGYQYDLWKPQVITPTKQYSLVNVTVNNVSYPNIISTDYDLSWTIFAEYRPNATKYDANVPIDNGTTLYFTYGDHKTVRNDKELTGNPTAADYLLIVTMLFEKETLFDGAVSLVNDSNRTIVQAVKAANLTVTLNGSTISGIGEYTVSDSAFWNFTVNGESRTESYPLNNGDVLKGIFTSSGTEIAEFRSTVYLTEPPKEVKGSKDLGLNNTVSDGKPAVEVKAALTEVNETAAEIPGTGWDSCLVVFDEKQSSGDAVILVNPVYQLKMNVSDSINVSVDATDLPTISFETGVNVSVAEVREIIENAYKKPLSMLTAVKNVSVDENITHVSIEVFVPKSMNIDPSKVKMLRVKDNGSPEFCSLTFEEKDDGYLFRGTGDGFSSYVLYEDSTPVSTSSDSGGDDGYTPEPVKTKEPVVDKNVTVEHVTPTATPSAVPTSATSVPTTSVPTSTVPEPTKSPVPLCAGILAAAFGIFAGRRFL